MIIIFFILFFLYIFGPVFNSLGAWADTILFFSVGLSFVHYVIKGKRFPVFVKDYYRLVFLFLAVGIIASFYIFITSTDVLQIFMRPVRIIVTLLAGYALADMVSKKYNEKAYEMILQFIFFSIVFHGLIMIYQFDNPAFRDLIYQYTSTGDFRSSFDYEFRMGGLSGGTGGAVLSVVQSIGVVLLPFLLKLNVSAIRKAIFVAGSLLCVYSVFICGRSGLWNALLFTPVAVYLSDSNIKFSTIIRFFILFICLFLGFGFIMTFLESGDVNNPLFMALSRTFDTFTGYEQTGSFSDDTVNELTNHIILPDDGLVWLIGDTDSLINTQFDRNLNSDIGIIRNIWNFGFFGTLLFLYPFWKYLKLSFKEIKVHKSAQLLFIVSVITFFFHFKESFLYTRMLFSIYSIMLGVFYFQKKDYPKTVEKI